MNELRVGFNDPLRDDDSETQTYGCRANNPDICKNNEVQGICAFVREDKICKSPSRAWKRKYNELKGGRIMSEIQNLIDKFCPNGVEYKRVGDIAEVGTGSSNGNEASDEGAYPFFIRSQTVKAKDDYEYDEEAIIIPGEGGVGDIYHYINGKYALHQRVYRIHFITNEITTRFAYYCFNEFFKTFIIKKAVSATVTSIRKPMIQDFIIPLPPLPVQEEIVRILDNFTYLTAELQAELQARAKQYEYYRDTLLSFGDEVDDLPLEEILKIKNGSDYKSFNEGEYPVYGSGGIMTYVDRFAYDKPSVLIPRKGSIDKLYYVESPFWNVDTIFYTDINAEKVIPKYVFYCLQKEHLEQYNTAGGVPSLTQKVLNKVKIPVPSIEEQKRIVDILDRFDALCGNFTEGLPAEIEARQKQYEYYRNKLLTFKELGA